MNIVKFIHFFFLGTKKKGGTSLERLVSIARYKNKKKILFSNNRLKPQNQESPKIQEVTGNNATTSKINNSSTSLVNYDSSSSDNDT